MIRKSNVGYISSKKGIMKKVINKALSFLKHPTSCMWMRLFWPSRVIGQKLYEEKGLSTTVVENFPRKDRLSDTKQLTGTPFILYQGQISADRGSHCWWMPSQLLKGIP
jgi:hypothetical protein